MTQQLQPPSRPGQSAGSETPPAQPRPTASGGSTPSVPLHGDRRSLRVAAVLLILGELVYAVATPMHPGGNDPIDQFVMYAADTSWGTVHAIQFASAIMLAFGVLALVHGLNVNSGARGLVNRFAGAAAVAGIAVNAAVYAVDGVALKQAADSWVSAPAAAQPALFAALQAIRGVEWGLRGYAAYTLGLSLVLLAIVIVSTARVPRTVGYLIGLTGLVYIALGVGYGDGYTALSDHSTVGNISYYLVVLVWIWAIWLLVTAWRMAEPDPAAVR